MRPRRRVLRMYGLPTERAMLDWEWVDRQLTESGTYWVVPRAEEHPHPRPVWGVWHDYSLHLSIGSPTIARAVAADPRVTVHLESGTDVVIVEGLAILPTEPDAAVLIDYNSKYQWDYRVDQYGQLTRLEPTTVLAWRAGGWAGRDSFQATASWALDPAEPDLT